MGEGTYSLAHDSHSEDLDPGSYPPCTMRYFSYLNDMNHAMDYPACFSTPHYPWYSDIEFEWDYKPWYPPEDSWKVTIVPNGIFSEGGNWICEYSKLRKYRYVVVQISLTVKDARHILIGVLDRWGGGRH